MDVFIENSYKTSMRRVLDNIVAIVLGIVSSAVFAQILMQGELTKSIVYFYQKEHSDDPVAYPANVTEMFVIEMEFLKITFHLTAGAAIVFLSYLLKKCMQPNTMSRKSLGGMNDAAYDSLMYTAENVSRTKRDTIVFMVLTLGLILWNVGYLIIGYDKPSWGTFNIISMAMIAFGGGLFIWGSFILFMNRISEISDTTTWTSRAILGVFASGPPLFILFFFSNLQYLATETEFGGDKHQFYLVYRNIGTVMLPFTCFVILVSFMDVCTYGCFLPSEMTEYTAAVLEKSAVVGDSDMLQWNTPRWWISMVTFLLSKVFFGVVFFGSTLLYSNWIHHVDGPSSFHVTAPEFGFNTNVAGSEIVVTRTAMLLMASGLFVGRMLFAFAVDFPRLRPENKKNILNVEYDDPIQIGWSLTVRFIAHLFAIGGIVGWHFRTKDVTTYSTGDIYGLVFLIGLGNGSIFLDTFVSAILYYRTDKLPSYKTDSADLRLILTLLSMIPLLLAIHRFSTGSFGDLGTTYDRQIDYGYYTKILSIFIGVSAVLDLVSFISHPAATGTAICCSDNAVNKVAGNSRQLIQRLKETGDGIADGIEDLATSAQKQASNFRQASSAGVGGLRERLSRRGQGNSNAQRDQGDFEAF